MLLAASRFTFNQLKHLRRCQFKDTKNSLTTGAASLHETKACIISGEIYYEKSKLSVAAHRLIHDKYSPIARSFESETPFGWIWVEILGAADFVGIFGWKLQVQQMLEKMILQKHINLSYVSADQKRQILQLFSIYKKIESAAFQVGCKVSFATTEW